MSESRRAFKRNLLTEEESCFFLINKRTSQIQSLFLRRSYLLSKETRDSLKVFMFLSFQFTDTQPRYHIIEREVLSIMKNLLEVR